MKRLILLGFLSCLALEAAAAEPFPLQAKRILFLGDSITNAGHYIADLEMQLRLNGVQCPELINLGLPSETCTGLSEPDHPFPRPDVHERLERALTRIKPDVVVACYGMNDGIYYPFSEERFAAYQAGIKQLVSKVKAAGAKMVLMTPPPFDPVPLQGKNKLRPTGAEKYAWFAVYEHYDRDVIRRYADWIREVKQADMVIDLYKPMQETLSAKRKQAPDFHFAADGVHMNADGHEVLAQAILEAWGVTNWQRPPTDLHDFVEAKTKLLHDAWLSHVGHKRPGVKAGLPLDEAEQKAEALEAKIESILAEKRQN